MLTIERPSSARNVLIVTGPELATGDYRETLASALPGVTGTPVRRGTHDFWITYFAGSGNTPNFNLEDMKVTPRPRRGIVEMAAPPTDTTMATMQNQVSILLQEVGHHWLTPWEMMVGHPDFWPAPHGPFRPALAEEAGFALHDGTPFTGPLLLGRDNAHWASYFHADASPLDGVSWRVAPDEDGINVWTEGQVPPLPTVQPAGLGPITVPNLYCDLDLLIMGCKTAAEAYSTTGNQFRWLEPQLTTPLDYHAGLCVAFGPNDIVCFGFYRHHKKLGIQATGGPLTEFDLPGYRPFSSPTAGIALRVIRRGDTYHFQAKLDDPGPSPAATPRLLNALDPIPSVTTGASLDQFRTLATFTRSSAPVAIGFLNKTWTPILARASFCSLEIATGTAQASFATTSTPALYTGALSGLTSGILSTLIPQPGPTVQAVGRRLHIQVPYAGFDANGVVSLFNAFDAWFPADSAPRVLTRAPAGDFAFATSARMERTAFSPWAAGAARGTTMWGRQKTASSTGVIPPPLQSAKRDPPPNNAYKTAFMLCAPQRSDITNAMISSVDATRRYFDAAFAIATANRRTSQSTLG